MKKQHGFTLVEIILTLTLMGFLASVVGVGLSDAMRGFFFTHDIATSTLKGQMTMARLSKMLTNLTALEQASATGFSVTYRRENDIITERLMYSAKEKKLWTTISTSGAGNFTTGRFPVQNDLVTFNVAYKKGDGSEWNSSSPIDSLARVIVSLGMQAGDSSITFVNAFVPRNTYVASQFSAEGLLSAVENSKNNGDNCFVATAAFGDGAAPVVILLKKFRDTCLMPWEWGRKLVAWYYQYGPIAASAIRNNIFLCLGAQMLLYPFAGFMFLWTINPLLLMVVPFLAFLANRIVRSVSTKVLVNSSGSALVSIIGVMVFVATLMSGMVPLQNSASLSTLALTLSPKAYFLAESGIRYAGHVYAAKVYNGDDEIDAAVELIHNKIFKFKNADDTLSSNKFELSVRKYWFTPSGLISPFSASFLPSASGNPPERKAQGALLSGNVALYIPSSEVVAPVGNVSVTPDGGLVMYFQTPQQYAAKDQLLFAAKTHNITRLGKENATFSIGRAIEFFPPNGVVLAKVGKISRYVAYRTADYKTGTLSGLEPVAGKEDFGAGGLELGSGTDIILQPHIEVTSKGMIETGYAPVVRTIVFNQPLMKIDSILHSAFSSDFSDPSSDDDFKDEDGSHENGDESLKVTGAVVLDTVAVAGKKGLEPKGNVSLKKKDAGVKKALKAREKWDSAEHIVVYDMQAKIKFNRDDDQVHTTMLGQPIPPSFTWGSWATGVSFDIADNKNGTSTSNSLRLNFICSYSGSEQRTQIFHGERPDLYWDGITDTFLQQHGENKISKDNNVDGVVDDRFWKDKSMFNGVPYLMLWSKDEFAGDKANPLPVVSGLSDDSHMLAKYPLAELQPVVLTIYKRINDEMVEYPQYIKQVGSIAAFYERKPEYENQVVSYISEGNATGWELESAYLIEYVWTFTGAETDSLIAVNAQGALIQVPAMHYLPMYVSSFEGYEIHDIYNVLNHVTVPFAGGTVSQIGEPYLKGTPLHGAINAGGMWINATSGKPVLDAGFSIDKPVQYIEHVNAESDCGRLSANYSYKFWMKDWTTIQVTLTEVKGNYHQYLGTDKVAVVSAAFATPDGNAESDGSIKIIGRKAYPVRESEKTFLWPQDGDYFRQVQWEERNKSPKIWQIQGRFTNYSSELISGDSVTGALYGVPAHKQVKITLPSADDDGDYIYALSNTGVSTVAEDAGLVGIDVGMNTLGIGKFDSSSANEYAYFDDFSIQIYEITSHALQPGAQQEK